MSNKKDLKVRKGDIIIVEAYAQSKMLDHQDWAGLLPRNIMPSDVDLMMIATAEIMQPTRIACSKAILLIEFSRHHRYWKELSYGQRLSYIQDLQLTLPERKFCILAKHSVDTDTKINTVKDIESYQVMWYDGENIQFSRLYKGNFVKMAQLVIC
jgi:hypothetical protein